jgi:uncharacterized caspase-like protein
MKMIKDITCHLKLRVSLKFFYLLLLLVINFLSSCSTTIETKIPANLKLTCATEFRGTRAALIINDDIRKAAKEIAIKGRCANKKGQTDYIYARVEYGEMVVQHLSKFMRCVFEQVDIFQRESDVVGDYDFIIVPKLTVDVSHDEEKAISHKLFSDYTKISDEEFKKNLYSVEAVAELVLDIHSPKVFSNYEISAKSLVSDEQKGCNFTRFYTNAGYCGNNAGDLSELLTNAYIRVIKAAICSDFKDIGAEEKITPLYAFVKAKFEEKALPSSLALTPRFNDSKSFLPNTTLDAGEEAELIITVKNDGKGSGYGTVLKLTTDNPKVIIDKEISLGDIPPGETKEVKVHVKAALDLADGQLSLQMTCSEKRGYNCKNYKLEVQSAKLEKPELVITGYKINDGNTGLASGNGNGIPENGETIEIIPLVKNNGVGDAINIELSIASINSGIDVKTKSTTINRITPGQTASGNLVFAVPATFSDKAINLTLSATDVRGIAAAGTSKQFALNTEINKPVIVYTYKIIDSMGNVRNEVQNGEYAEIEIKPINRGQLEARNVTIDLASATADFTKKRDEISRLGAQAEYSPIRFPFHVPRVTDKNSIDVAVRLEQKDFPGISDTINIPIKLVRPDFKVTYQLLDQNGNGILEQGETADLLVRVENIGQLDAEGVMLNMEIAQKGISIIGTKEANIGRLEARKASEQKRFSIAVQRSADPGSVSVNFTVSESTFGKKNIPLAMNIAKEQEEVITVQGQERPKRQVAVASARTNFPPVIAIALPRDNDRVASEQTTVSGVATTEKGISQIEVSINGKRFDPSGRGVRVRAKESDQRERDFIFESIPLQDGANSITVTAYDNENLSTTKTITVHRESKKGEIYAAVIGINQYKDNKLNLRYARNDAESFADYLRTNLGLDKDHLFELYDERATTKEIKSLLGKKIRQKANRPEDTVYVFFAGHGAPEQDVRASDEDKIRKYILSHDSMVDDLYATGIPMDEVAQIFSGINAERIIFVIDSCYSGAGGGRTILAQGNRAVLSEDFLNRLSQGKGRIILTSSKPNEVSKESDELKHGFFTYYLLEGLKGKADINSDGIVDLDEISFYLNKIVPDNTGGEQHPVKKGESEGMVVVGRVL